MSSNLASSVSFFFYEEGLYALKTKQESVKIKGFYVCLFFRARTNYVNIYVHMITLQLLVNQECRTTNLGSKANQSRFTSDYTCDHVYTCT